jgi:hypothetical protein
LPQLFRRERLEQSGVELARPRFSRGCFQPGGSCWWRAFEHSPERKADLRSGAMGCSPHHRGQTALPPLGLLGPCRRRSRFRPRLCAWLRLPLPISQRHVRAESALGALFRRQQDGDPDRCRYQGPDQDAQLGLAREARTGEGKAADEEGHGESDASQARRADHMPRRHLIVTQISFMG